MADMNWRTAPLPVIWPNGKRTPASQRKTDAFRVGASQTMYDLERELGHLGVRGEVVVMAGYREQDIRLDGRPRAGARPDDPAVAVAFDSRYGPLTYACDTYRNYDANLRAIALGLAALRAVDRYGITKSGQQYTGWTRLGSGDATVANDVRPKMTYAEASAFLHQHSGSSDWADSLELHYKSAVKRLHPDAGGSREDWDLLQEVKAVLGI